MSGGLGDLAAQPLDRRIAVVAPVQAGLALFLALLINIPLRGINVFRAIYFMPVVVSIVVVAFLWRFIPSIVDDAIAGRPELVLDDI